MLLLAGCQSLPPAPTEVRVPVAVPCLDKMPDRPEFATDAQLASMDDYRFVLALAKDRLERQGYIATIEAIMQACVR